MQFKSIQVIQAVGFRVQLNPNLTRGDVLQFLIVLYLLKESIESVESNILTMQFKNIQVIQGVGFIIEYLNYAIQIYRT